MEPTLYDLIFKCVKTIFHGGIIVHVKRKLRHLGSIFGSSKVGLIGLP
jgi:hypothetical protein